MTDILMKLRNEELKVNWVQSYFQLFWYKSKLKWFFIYTCKRTDTVGVSEQGEIHILLFKYKIYTSVSLPTSHGVKNTHMCLKYSQWRHRFLSVSVSSYNLAPKSWLSSEFFWGSRGFHWIQNSDYH